MRALGLHAVSAVILFLASPTRAQQAAVPSPDGWPRVKKTTSGTYTVYQPQLDSWDGYRLAFHAAASVQPPVEKAAPVFGVLDFTARTQTDKLARIVELHDLRVQKATFPSARAEEQAYKSSFQTMVPAHPPVVALDRLETQLAILGAEKKGQAQQVENVPPSIIFSERPAVLVYIDGEPAWRPAPNTSLERVINTRALILRDPKTGQNLIHVFDGWVESATLEGPWARAKKVPSKAGKVAKEAGKSGAADLMEGAEDPKTKKRPSLEAGVPLLVVASRPTEVITTVGPPQWATIEGTGLLYVSNTTGDVFRDIRNQKVHVLISGRWFAAASMEGPWTYVAGSELPADFARIPDDSPKENVKASVPGTRQAEEAVIAAQIPQTATVYVDKASFKPTLAGAPILVPIEGTALSQVTNSPDPIVRVSPSEWYALQNAVWFTAPSIQGPWVVAKAVPAAIYAIPASSPVHYITYVRIYDARPTYVVVGYTAGYMGTMITPAGVVVYGTGYVYPPYVGATVWYGPPVTYGYAVNVTYTPWTGWAFGYMAVGVGVWYAPAPYWGPTRYYGYAGVAYAPYGGGAAWGPGGWAATSGNVYSRWGSTTAVTRSSAGYNAWTGNAWNSEVGRSYNSATGRISAGQRGSVQNVYTGNYASGGRGATYNPGTGVGVAGSKVTVGNSSTGSQATAGRGVVTGPGGQSTSVAGVKGQQGSAARVGDSYYGTKDGNVYKSNSQGGFDQVTPRSGTGAVDRSTADSLQREQAARQTGEQRAAGARAGEQRATGARTGEQRAARGGTRGGAGGGRRGGGRGR